MHAAAYRARIIGIDASAGMLDQARAKSWPRRGQVRGGHGGGTGLRPGVLGSRQSRAGGVRGVPVPQRDRAGQGAWRRSTTCSTRRARSWSRSTRWTAPGSPRRSGPWSAGRVVIPLSWLTSRQTRLYRYLWRSVLHFDSVDTFVDRLYAAGFVDVRGAYGPGLAAQHPAHLPGAQAGGVRRFHDQPRPAPAAGDRAETYARCGIRRRPGRRSRPARQRDRCWSPAAASPAWPRRSAWPSAASR